MRVYLEAREIPFEERDITADPEIRRTMTEQYDSHETPTMVVFSQDEEAHEVVTGFNPARLDLILASAPSSDAVTES
jgi:hypothetical protein